MESQADNSITPEERDKSSSSEEEQSSITTENSSEGEIDPWTTLIDNATSKVRAQDEEILQTLLMEGQNEKAKQKEISLKKFLLLLKKNWATSTWITWHG